MRASRLAILLSSLIVFGCGGTSTDGGSVAEQDAAFETTDPIEVGPVVDGELPAETSAPPDSSTPPDASVPDTSVPGVPAVRFVGRFDKSDPAGPKFAWSGSQIRARFTGTGVKIKLGGAANRFAVVIDGGAPKVLVASSGTNTYTIATGLAPGTHEVIVHRRTEAFFGESQFFEFTFDGGALLPPSPAPDRRIEIIGDSITAGYGNEGTHPCKFGPETEDHYRTYAAIAARALGADLHALPWSGIGMYRNNDGSTTGTMPERYGRALPEKASSAWDFTSFTPHVVVINLGTNDFAPGDPGASFTNAYLAFVRRVRKNHPSAFIFTAVGSMMSGTGLTQTKKYLQTVIDTMTGEGDTKIAMMEFAVQQASDGYGCDYHPNLVTNEKMAKVMETTIRAKLGW